MANYPPVNVSDGVEIKSSWRLIHDGHTPFGDTLWLSIIAQPGTASIIIIVVVVVDVVIIVLTCRPN